MDLSGKIDLHMHTTVSDGTDTPEEIVARVRDAGIGLFSVTDHDAVKAGRIILPLLAEGDPVFLTGVEFSCRDKEGKYHILGYGYDPDAAPIRGLVENGHRLRIRKLKARLDFLRSAFGFSFSQEAQEELFCLDNPGKPHLANLMVRQGYAGTKEDAIKNYINKLRFGGVYFRPEEAIGGILAGGGIPVLAHPSYGSGDERIVGEEMDRRLKKLMALGLQGVEAYYAGFDEELRKEMLSFAERYGLYVTAGSDYHGKNKKVPLGDTGLGGPDEWPDGLRRFLADVRKQRGQEQQAAE